MTFKTLTDQLSVSAQISPEAVAEAAKAGFSVIIANRPDGEDPGQPDAAAMRAAAEAAGLTWVHIPVSGGQFPPDAVAAFKEASAKGKTLAYCRSGTRCTVLWALGKPEGLSADEIISRAADAGYDISGLRTHLES
jgi:sulfide:quinone oxidoreductase